MPRLIIDTIRTLLHGIKRKPMKPHTSGVQVAKDGTRSVSMYDIMDETFKNEGGEFKSMDHRDE